ncbi:putative replication factor [Singapore grouper iridovirus]|uniref:Putative replication factor n=2 Tax=Singapore grouper iridovirus TaxID=262968 RepID=Q5GAE9_9VIRU|nr:putative replication factor [Singapore grouper iridovirus]AAS18131.1 putative replication factor [Singapore grouper iridovirus]AAV91094.1 putative replication factor [Grouper iridovirus]WAU86825.1 putative replication factor [Singapore grouper iridovirus]WRW24672.1 putative replication factor [Singapore grouper iridovirus]
MYDPKQPGTVDSLKFLEQLVKDDSVNNLLLSLYGDERKLLDYKTWTPPKPVDAATRPCKIVKQMGVLKGHFSEMDFKVLEENKRKIDVHKQCGWISKFKDAIRRYQGRQSCKIPNKVLDDLDRKLAAYNLLVEGVEGFVRYAKVTKHHVAIFLKELKHSKQYDNVNLIYYILTDKRDDVSYLERQLTEDFKILLAAATEHKLEHLINVKYSLYQLLKKHGHSPDRPDVLTVKASSKGNLYDDVYRKLYDHLGWEFTAL